MKNFGILLFCALLLTACASTKSGTGDGLSLMEAIEQSAEKTAGELSSGSKVAVVAFESSNAKLSEFIMEELNGALKDRGIDIVERSHLKLVMQEQNFQMSGYVSDETAVSIGKFIGANMVITGQLSSIGGMYRFRSSAIDVEKAVRASITRYDLRNDRTLQQMLKQ